MILTGQYVHINQTPASVGERMLAQIIDWVIQIIYLLGITFIIFRFELLSFSSTVEGIVLVFIVLLPTLFYGFLCEWLANGQTIGKHLLKMRVVKTDGSQPSVAAYLLRWLFMIIDGPTLSGLGVVVMMLNKDTRRIGDLAAGTMVIKQNSYHRLHISLDEFAPFSRNYRPVYPAVESLSLEQIALIDQTLQFDEHDPRIHALAEQVKRTLSIDHVHESDDSAFLWRIKRDYQYYALEEI